MVPHDPYAPLGSPSVQQPRPLHLEWNGEEWTDNRCGCRYHPDDDNMSHGGAPHVHLCAKHREANACATEARDRERWSDMARAVRNAHAESQGGEGSFAWSSGDALDCALGGIEAEATHQAAEREWLERRVTHLEATLQRIRKRCP